MLETAVGGAEDGISSGDTNLEMIFLSPDSSIINRSGVARAVLQTPS